jgi:hypothetical protein
VAVVRHHGLIATDTGRRVVDMWWGFRAALVAGGLALFAWVAYVLYNGPYDRNNPWVLVGVLGAVIAGYGLTRRKARPPRSTSGNRFSLTIRRTSDPEPMRPGGMMTLVLEHAGPNPDRVHAAITTVLAGDRFRVFRVPGTIDSLDPDTAIRLRTALQEAGATVRLGGMG